MAGVELTIACGDYDRTRPLITGDVVADGIELSWSSPPIEQTITRMLREEAFDVAEMSLSATAIAVNRGRPAFVAIPVFPSRFFRHSSVFVNSDSGITSFQQLAGKRVGMYNYHRIAAGVWFKGLLSSEYGIQPGQIDWYVADPSPHGEQDRIHVTPPANVQITSIGSDESLDSMLEEGRLDAVLAVRLPEPFRQGSPNVRRLLEKPMEAEIDYHRRTGVFPIMHALVIRTEVFARSPWVGVSLCEGFEKARLRSERVSDDIGEARHSLAWWLLYREQERDLLGDAWAYGVEPNHNTLSVFLQYCFAQGLTDHLMTPEELFADCPWSP